MENKRVFVTGGAGTLGRALISRGEAEDWHVKWTVYSRDPVKHQALKRMFPHADITPILGDVADLGRMEIAMVGHDMVIHAGAQKHIPEAEANPWDCVVTNVIGSRYVALAAVGAGVKRVVGLSTDKAAESVNVYGHSKGMMEGIFLEMARVQEETVFTLCRYGNVLGSTGSVLTVWDNQMKEGLPITITDGEMTRFWLTEDDAVDLILKALEVETGTIVVPIAPGLDMLTFAKYLMGDDVAIKEIGRRPGEKKHECLLGREEFHYAVSHGGYIFLNKNDPPFEGEYRDGYYSNTTYNRISRDKLRDMVGWES